MRTKRAKYSIGFFAGSAGLPQPGIHRTNWTSCRADDAVAATPDGSIHSGRGSGRWDAPAGDGGDDEDATIPSTGT